MTVQRSRSHNSLFDIGTRTHDQIDAAIDLLEDPGTGFASHVADLTIHFTQAQIDHDNIQSNGFYTHEQLDAHVDDSSLHFSEGAIDHDNILNSGAYTHSAIDSHIDDASIHFSEASIDHANILSIGTNTHAQIDTHIADSTTHFTEASIDHTSISNIGTNTHAQIDTHIADTSLHFTIPGASGDVVLSDGAGGPSASSVIHYSSSHFQVTGRQTITGNSDVIQLNILSDASQNEDVINVANSANTLNYFSVAFDGAIKMEDGRVISITDTQTGGINSIYIGENTGNSATGARNYIIGHDCFQSASASGNDNVGIGFNVLKLCTTGSNNVGLGYRVFNSLTEGSSNFGLGFDSCFSINTGDSNVGIGANALKFTTTADGNVAIGSAAGQANVSGGKNVYIGFESGKARTGGNHNICIGSDCGDAAVATSNNIFMGKQAGQANTGSNSIIIGWELGKSSYLTGSDTLAIHTRNSATPIIHGHMGVTDPWLRVNGYFEVIGNSDNTLMKMTGHSTMNNDYLLVEDNSNTALFRIDSAGDSYFGGDVECDGLTINDHLNLGAPTSIGASGSPYAILSTDKVIQVNNTSGSDYLLTLPLASASSGRIIFVQKMDSNAYNVTVQRSGSDTINGATSKSWTVQYDTFSFISNGTEWTIGIM